MSNVIDSLENGGVRRGRLPGLRDYLAHRVSFKPPSSDAAAGGAHPLFAA